MKTYQLIIALALYANFATAQSSFIPQNLGPEINSPYDELNPVISSDAKTLFFTRVNHPENTYGAKDSEDIWVSYWSDGTWSPAMRVPQLNIDRYNAVLSIFENGNAVLLHGIYNKKGNIWKKRGLSVSVKEGEAWGTPVKLRVRRLSKRNKGLKSSASMSADGNYLALSFSTVYNSDKTDLFLSQKKNNKWRRPVRMRKLNTRFNEEAPFLSADNNTIYFASDRKGKNRFDIYKSTRSSTKGKAWTKPVLLNDTINTTAWESYFKTNAKGSIAYFSSTRQPAGRADILKVKLFEENPFVVVSGKVLNAKSDRLLTGKQVTILANGVPADSVTFNSDSATYTIKLPLGKTHILSLQLADFTGAPDTVDVANVREFTTIEKDLKAIPLPYVLIKGKMLIKNTNEIIPSSAQPKIELNGVTADSAVVNLQEGSYELKVNYGGRHFLQVSADRFESLPEEVDLEAIDEYEVMIVDLEADAEKMALVTGYVIDKKTNKPLKALDKVKINVEGLKDVYASVDSTGKYQLKLALGQSYTIHAAAPEYFPVYERIDVTSSKADVMIFKDLVIVPIEIGQSVRLNNIFFDTGKSRLTIESFAELDRVVDFLINNTEIKIEIGGHTDNVGKAATNQKLSQARAKTVGDYIFSKGISKDRIVTRGYGMTKPVASNNTEEGKYENRRVEFTILNK